MGEQAEALALPLGQAARLLGAYRWVEHRLFELTGAWAAEIDLPAVALHLDEVSAQHAWHADLWAQRLPVLDDVDPEALTAPAPGVAPLLDGLAAEEGPVPRLAGLYRVVVPRLLVTYDRHLGRVQLVADGPTARTLRLVLRDELESWQAGEGLLECLLDGPDAVRAAADTEIRLESALVAARPGEGLVGWPEDPPRSGPVGS